MISTLKNITKQKKKTLIHQYCILTFEVAGKPEITWSPILYSCGFKHSQRGTSGFMWLQNITVHKPFQFLNSLAVGTQWKVQCLASITIISNDQKNYVLFIFEKNNSLFQFGGHRRIYSSCDSNAISKIV